MPRLFPQLFNTVTEQYKFEKEKDIKKEDRRDRRMGGRLGSSKRTKF